MKRWGRERKIFLTRDLNIDGSENMIMMMMMRPFDETFRSLDRFRNRKVDVDYNGVSEDYTE